MKNVLVKTSAGNTLTHPHRVVLVEGPKGLQEKYVSDLRQGQRILYKAEYAPHELEDIVGVLYEEIPGYKSDRDFIFVKDRREGKEYEIPRLRHDIFTSIRCASPEIFTQKELQEFDNRLFHVEGKEFENETLSAAITYLGQICKKCGLKYDYLSRIGWLTQTYHIDPRNLESAELIAIALENNDFFERAKSIKELPHSQNPYFELTDAHRRYSRMLREIPDEQDGESTQEEKKNTNKQRVHEAYLAWDEKVLEKFKSRKKEKIVEALVYDVNLLETGKKGGERPETYFSKGVVIMGDGSKKDEIYDKLNVGKRPQSRSNEVRNKIWESVGWLFQISMDSYNHLVEFDNLKKEGQKTDDNSHDLNLYTLDYINPMFDYNVQRLMNYYSWRNKKVLELLNEGSKYMFSHGIMEFLSHVLPIGQEERKKYRLMLKKTLPPEHPYRKLLEGFYRRSLLGQSMASEEEFVDRFSEDIRRTEKNLTSNQEAIVFCTPNRNAPGSSLTSEKAYKRRENKAAWLNATPKACERFSNMVRGDKRITRCVENIKSIDCEIPLEISSARTFSAYGRNFRKKKPETAEDKLMWQFFEKYDLNYRDDMYHPIINLITAYKDWVKKEKTDNFTLVV